MGMIAVFQQVPPAALTKLTGEPALLEQLLMPEEDSYAFDGYGDLTVDVSKSRMAAWEEIHRRLHGLGGEVTLTDGDSVDARDLAVERDAVRWSMPGSDVPEQRPHARVASLRLMPPLGQRLSRARRRVGDFAMSTVVVASLLTFLLLHLRDNYSLPPPLVALPLLVAAGAVSWKTITAFRRERIVVTYRHRRSPSIALPEPMDIDKAWEPMQEALARVDREAAAAVRKAIAGGREIAGSEIGYGPASYLTPEEVADVASRLGRVSLEAFGRECDPRLQEYVISHLRRLQEHYRDAASHGHAMIRYFA